jgi:hypothetical protein
VKHAAFLLTVLAIAFVIGVSSWCLVAWAVIRLVRHFT